jgi:pyruvate,water dikinase
MLRCWSSLYTDRAICYRRKMGYAEDGAAMSVGIQKMVLPRAAGVAFTLNPLDGDRSQIAIDASWGLGEAVVSGAVTPDNFLVDKVLGEITRRTISPKAIEHRLGDDDHVIEAEVEAERREVPCLTDDEIKAVAKLARRAEKHYRCPQDVEWALDTQLPDGENVLLLQSRPETVWSRKKRTATASTDPMASIVATLLDPHHGRAHSVG